MINFPTFQQYSPFSQNNYNNFGSNYDSVSNYSNITNIFNNNAFAYPTPMFQQQQQDNSSGFLQQLVMMLCSTLLNGQQQPNNTGRMNAAKASSTLLNNFDLIDSPMGDGVDGQSSWNEMQYVSDQTSDPQLRAAIKWFDNHPNEFHTMENLNSGRNTLNDNIFTVDELRKYTNAKNAAVYY